MSTPDELTRFDAIVVGTGFAGAVTACRLVEAGFKICVLERGRRYGPDDFPKYPTEDLFASDGKNQQNFAPPPDFSRWLWSRDHGIYDIRDLGETMSVQAAGYGGGSLIYANVHLRPPRTVFDNGWPEAYTHGKLDPYFDLAAYMLRASPIPTRIAKTVQLKRAASVLQPGAGNHWFRTPLAVTFDQSGANDDQPRTNDFGRQQLPCDMRGRCWRGCDRQAKNTLDLNYLARAEDGSTKPDIQTLAEVFRIERVNGMFAVSYRDLIFRGDDESHQKDDDENQEEGEGARDRVVYADHVFLCAGSVNTTELLLNSPHLWSDDDRKAGIIAPLGSHYFPNSDSLSVVFDCDEPHEADYGPTITSALLYQSAAKGTYSQSLDFECGHLVNGNTAPPTAGVTIRSNSSDAEATLVHDPVLDWGDWRTNAVGSLVLDEVKGAPFTVGERVDIGTQATAVVRSPVTNHEHWFLVEDGGYSPDLEPLVGVFRSPLWLRRNRYLEHERLRPTTPLRRPTRRLHLQAFADALGGTARGAAAPQGVLARSFDPTRLAANDPEDRTHSDGRDLLLTGPLGEQVKSILPEWFVTAIEKDRKELFEQAAALALPLLGRVLADLSTTLVTQIDPEMLSQFSRSRVDPEKAEVLVRGVLRQGLQIIAGSEVAVATKIARLLLDRVPGTPVQLLETLGDLLLWALAYDTNDGHNAVLLTMGRDLYRGRLFLPAEDGKDEARRLTATVPGRLLDRSNVEQERVLRVIASRGWSGELRTNPAWTALGKRVTVHSQGGCPMGELLKSVTNPEGEVHRCDNLYVMDAAAFPTSVGVNPSATIAAVAEFKIESFIRRKKKSAAWQASDKDLAKDWVDRQGRSELDPLNHADLRQIAEAVGANPVRPSDDLGVANQPTQPPDIDMIGLYFKEELKGFLTAAKISTHWKDLENFPDRVEKFRRAEDAGIRNGRTIEVKLEATVTDLALLISPDRILQPMEIPVTGTVTLGTPGKEPVECQLIRDGESFLQMFVRSSGNIPSVRFFRYELHYLDEDSRKCVINALKVLRNAPGFDFWLDTSTLYFELSVDRADPPVLHRGVLRVSIETFLRTQLRSMTITGTTDPARQSWALAAFYKYFVGELADVYMKRADEAADLLWKLVTGIHV